MVGYPPPCCTSDLRPTPSPLDISPLLLTSGGQHWRPLQTCSLEDPPRSDIWWWPLKHVRFASGRYASYWNAFLFLAIFTSLSVLSKGLWKAMTNQNSTVGRKEWLTSRGVSKDRGAKELNVHSINEIKFILLSNLIHLPVRWNVFEMAPNEVYYQYAFRRNGIWLVFGMFENKWHHCLKFWVLSGVFNATHWMLLQGYKLMHITYTIRWHYHRTILHSTVQGINKDTPSQKLQSDKPFPTATSMAEPLALPFKDMLTHRVNDPWPIEDQLVGP